jgi:hypothetical protein
MEETINAYKMLVGKPEGMLMWCPENKNSPTVAHACRKRRLKWVLGAWGYNWATLLLEDINSEAWSSGMEVGRGANNPTL